MCTLGMIPGSVNAHVNKFLMLIYINMTSIIDIITFIKVDTSSSSLIHTDTTIAAVTGTNIIVNVNMVTLRSDGHNRLLL